LVYLLVDGIDEFVVRRPDEASRLEKQLLALQGIGIHLIVSCRENLWFQQFQSRHDYQAIRILRFDQDQVQQLLRSVKPIPPGALDYRHHVREWLLNPMFLRFILDLSKGGGKVDFGDFRSQLYENWARTTLRENITDEPRIEAALRFYGDVALALVKDRKTALPMADVVWHLDQRFPRDRPNMDQILNNEVLRESDDTHEARFAHESIYEFFLARSLRDDFVKAASPLTPPASLLQLGLSQVELDYPQSAVYGFLQEFLDRDCKGRFEDIVRTSINRLASTTQAWRLIRNLIEYLGMIQCAADSDQTTAFELIKMAQSLPRVRYNALRALERVHPCAPRPYFRHVSDWGELDRGELINVAVRSEGEEVPYVMRGHSKQRPEPGRHWAWVPNMGNNPIRGLQKHVSHHLGLLLQRFLSSESDEGLSITASHAWIRWFDPEDAPLLDDLRAKARNLGHKYVQHNLALIGK
jgi:hypothetical protein